VPLPEKRPAEKHEAFIQRCMADGVMVREFPDAGQRRAVCERQWKKGATKMSSEVRPEFVTMKAPLTVEAAEGGKDLPRFRMVAYTGGLMQLAGFPHPVVVDLAGLEIPSQNLPVRLDHERRQGVGHTSRVAVEDGRLVAEGLISRDTSWARDVAKSGVNGFPWQASIGAAVVESEFVPPGQAVRVNGRTFEGPVHVVRRAVLKEISFVDSGADTETSARVAASEQENSDMDENTSDKTQVVENEPGKEAQKPETPSTAGTEVPTPAQKVEAAADPAAEMRAAAAAEQERINAIRKVCGTEHGEIAARAISEGWDATRTELEVLRASRPKAPAVHVAETGVTGQVLEAACLLTAGLADVEKLHDEKTLDVAARRFRGGIGLQELLLEAA